MNAPKQQPATSSAPRCSIRVLSHGSNLVIGQGSKGRPAHHESDLQDTVPTLRKTRFLRVDQLKVNKDEA